jgi:hypothetical protein
MPTAAQTKALADALKKATDSGALDRVSTLQFTIMKKFFPNKAGDGIDFAKVQMAMNLFANGKLRVMGAPGPRNGPALELVQLEERRRSGHPGECAEGDVDLSPAQHRNRLGDLPRGLPAEAIG